MKSKILVSYRRDDSSGYAGRLYDRLAERFAAERVFMDVQTIQPGVDFVHEIEEAVDASAVVIVLIGPRWLAASDREGRRRLDDPHDFVRLEVAAALDRAVRIFPVLVGGATMPSQSDLPAPLARLARFNAIELSDSRWAYDAERLVDALGSIVPPQPSPRERLSEQAPARAAELLEPLPPAFVPVGREREHDRYVAQLRQGRSVVVTGMAGVGKTTLGASVAREVVPEDKIFWFTFDSVEKSGADALFWALAAFLETRGEPELWHYLHGELESSRPLDTTVKLNLFLAGLSNGGYLLCFDDFHVVRDADDVTNLFRILEGRLAARRQELAVRFLIMGRDVPDAMQHLAAEPLGGLPTEGTEAILARHGLTLEPRLLRRLHERTEGNPKLVDLASSAIGHMADDAEAIGRFIDSMASARGIRDYLMTHVYQTLSREEQIVTNVLSIFPAPVERRVVEEIVHDEGVSGVAALLMTLTDKAIASELADGRTLCHGLVRDYCYALLDRRDRERFHLAAARQFEALDKVLPAAYHHGEHGDQAKALRLLSMHAQALIDAGSAGALLEGLERFDPQRLGPAERFAFVKAKGAALIVRGGYRDAVALYEASLEDYPDGAEGGELLCMIGHASFWLNEVERAIDASSRAIEIDRPLGNERGLASAYRVIGVSHLRLGRLQEAREAFDESRRLAERLDDRLLLAQLLHESSLIAFQEERLEDAQSGLERSRALYRQLGARVGEARATLDLAVALHAGQAAERARATYERSLELLRHVGDVDGLCGAHNNLATLHLDSGENADAILHYEELRELAGRIGDRRWLATASAGLAEASMASGDVAAAHEHALEAIAIARELESWADVGVSLRLLGEIALAAGDAASAVLRFEESITILADTREHAELEKARRALGAVRAARHPGTGATGG